jgi:hypothetical protein
MLHALGEQATLAEEAFERFVGYLVLGEGSGV